MQLVVTEKPSVGRDIARVLNCRERGDGFLKGKDHVVTWAVGHLVTLVEPDELDERYKKWRAQDLPILPERIPTKVISKTRSQYAVIKKWMNAPDIERIICATDAGREGELIFGLIYEKAGCNKPVDRLWISSMTDAAIKEGFETLKPSAAYSGLYDSAVCRSQADWLVGMNASRAFTLSYNALLSVGRVQTPTLALLVKRAKEIRAFVPEEYHTLTADFGDYKGQWFDPQGEDERTNARIADKKTADAIAKAVKGKTGTVSKVLSEDKRELPPPLFDLTSLQREANKRLGFTADRTLKTAQALYEQRKAITYPRTDSRHLPRDMVPRVYKAMDALEAHFSQELRFIQRKEGKLPFSPRIYDDKRVTDHHAIIPTPQSVDPAKLKPDERALYELVVRRFIAAFCAAHTYQAIRVETQVVDHAFKTTGRVVTEPGWKQVWQSEKEEDGEQAIPPVRQGEARQVLATSVKKDSTKPPAPHTDASLLAAMEHAGRAVEDEELRDAMKGSGLGTPATRASIIERLIKVNYAQRRGRALTATDKGEKLIDVVPPEIASPEMTGRWEQALDQIAKKERDTERFMQGIRRLTAFLVTYAANEKKDVVFEREVKGRGGKVRAAVKTLPNTVCPLCGKAVVENAKAFGCSDWRSGCNFTLWKDGLSRAGGPRLTPALTTKLLNDKVVRGSTGTLELAGETLRFTRKGEERPAAETSIRYQRKTKA